MRWKRWEIIAVAVVALEVLALAIFFAFWLRASSPASLAPVPTPTSTLPANPTVILATTTSTRDTGLLDVLIPDFKARTGYVVKPIAVGSGAALAMGQRGEADVLLVHAPDAEKRLVESGAVTGRWQVMSNSFAIVGPASDPAGIRGLTVAVDAMVRIAEKQANFVSRGDSSGTDQMEKSLWSKAGVTPSGAWYQESGQGMGATLGIASEKDGYTLTDRGTYLALKATFRLEALLEGDPALLNIYSVMPVNGQRFPRVNAAGGLAFAEYLISEPAQEIIRRFGADRYGEPLFTGLY